MVFGKCSGPGGGGGGGDILHPLVAHGAVNPSAAPMGLPVEGLK